MVRFIVAVTYERGRHRARVEELPLGPRGVRIISTSVSDSTRAARGCRLTTDEVIWDDGWWDGKYAEMVQAILAPCFL